MFKKYLNSNKKFIKGYWKDENLEDVATEVPEYLEFLLSEKQLCFEEESAIKEALSLNESPT